MSWITKLKKDELRLVAEELGLTVPKGAKVIDLKGLIENSDIYRDEPESVQNVVDVVLEEKRVAVALEEKKAEKEKLDSQVKLELERIKLAQLEKELEIVNLRKESSFNTTQIECLEQDSSNNSLENFIKSIRTLTIPMPTKAGSINLFFQSLENAFKIKNVPEHFKPEILLNMLGEKASNLIVYTTEEDLGSYQKLKTIVLKEFQPTAQDCLNNFRNAVKLTSETYVQYASRLSACFEYYCQIREVNDFKSLCELVVSDKIFSSLDRDLMTHIGVKQGESFFKPQQLGRECDLYMSSKVKGKNEFNAPSRPFKHFPIAENRRNEIVRQKYQNGSFQRNAPNVLFSEVKSDRCVVCKNNVGHALNLCPQFRKLSVPERVEMVKTAKACFKCLNRNCCVRQCRSRNCFCGKPHNKLIHYSREQIKSNSTRQENTPVLGGPGQSDSGAELVPTSSMDIGSSQVGSNQVVATSFTGNRVSCVLLSTVRARAKSKSGDWVEVRCLLDVGSQASLISKECAGRLQLKNKKINTVISCLNDSSMVVNGCVSVTIANKDKSFERELSMLVVPKITDLIPNREVDVFVDKSEIVPLADYSFTVPGKIDILLGAEVFYELLQPGQICSRSSQLRFQNTVFGYVASGIVNHESEAKIHCGLIREDDLNKTLRKFWELESVEVELVRGKEAAYCEEHFKRTHWRNEEGRYVVAMPLKEDASCLGKSREIALKRLKSLWNRLSRSPEYLKLYSEFLGEYLSLGHMKEVIEDKEPDVVYYATHHGVYRPEKSSTKLRVVFNCSTTTSNGVSLNSLQYNGGVIQEDLFAIMLQFRTHIYALTADIRMMYRMILIDPSQHRLQRILWRESEDAPVKTYELKTVTYGTVSAPFLAMRTLKQLSFDEKDNFPLASPVLRDNFYMDDVLCGAPTLEEARELQRQLIGILARAGMRLHKWCGNHPKLSQNTDGKYNFYSQAETKTLGVSWRPLEDCFVFRVTVELGVPHTKRSVLSIIARIFDPLGLLGPVVAKAKIFMQKLWRLNIDWNDPLPVEEGREWHQFLTTLNRANEINVKRCIVIRQPTTIEVHGFADASERCLGAVVYCKSINVRGEIQVKLISSKSRVAPLRSLTIPRLELCAAVLLSKLVKRVLSALKLTVKQVYLWSDSMIVLSWIQKEPISLKPFVQNRVAAIQELTNVQQWGHVVSEQNPADLISRGMDADVLLTNDIWWHGPEFLAKNVYPNREITLSENRDDFDNELKILCMDNKDKCSVLSLNVNDCVYDFIRLSNNYLTVLRIVSYIFRFINNSKTSSLKVIGPLRTSELNHAETVLIRMVQKEAFSEDIRSLQRQGRVSSNSRLKALNPFLDQDNILRVGGRLANAEVSFSKKHPAVLPKTHEFTRLVIMYFHKRNLHVGASALLYHVREKFWPLCGRSICRKIVHDCIVCFRAKPIASTQLMGDLPKDRVVPTYPFNCSGVDFCGPFKIRYRNQRKGILHKVYVCIFVCFVSRAVHIEIVSDLTSEAFIATLKRFIARRGKCARLYSDNGGNFVGANREIKRLFKLVKGPDESLANYLSAEGIDWVFSPPRAPTFGGLWEAAVKSFKYHFKRVVGGANLNYEEFLTVITQIEGVLNSRPLSPLSESEDDFGVLTPAHFLIGRSIDSIVEPDLTNLNENKLRKWQRITQLVQLIWKKWHRSYLSDLQQRNKWRFQKNNVKVGDLVIMIEDNLPTHKWPLGRLTEMYFGNDGLIRVVKVKTQDGIFKRAISKICVLPMNE